MTYDDQAGLARGSSDPHATESTVGARTIRAPSNDPLQYQVPPDQTVTAALVQVVDEVAAVDLTCSERTLADVVDPDAIDSMFPPGESTDVRLEFELWDCTVSITGERLITVSTVE